MTTSRFNVLKVDCASCVMVIEGICEDTAGVKTAEVNARQRTLTVEHDANIVSADRLAKILSDEGYPVEHSSDNT
ncbi:MAG: heavy-metal-associated domain-containing protein [Candidatus Kerfeldbacteria bacterium]|nr:heavy-metal-associated domain-containing protein [Candidatus Kerfeldbacteria bacterium]